MIIGVVCEGETDFLAISSFLKTTLERSGQEVSFKDLQPNLDASSGPPKGGWPNAMAWLESNTLAVRKAAYLGHGLFGGGLSHKKCDMIFIQIDTDVLDGDDFSNYIRKRSGNPVAQPADAGERFDEVQRVLVEACGFLDEDEAWSELHIIAPAVENTETWCVAVRDPVIPNIESLPKFDIALEFLTRLNAFEGGGAGAGGVKNVERRRAYCEAHQDEANRIEEQCGQYRKIAEMFDR